MLVSLKAILGNAICYCLNEEGFETLKSFEHIDLYLENKKNECC
jgi:hypothetical protein